MTPTTSLLASETMSRDVAEAEPDRSAIPVEPAVLGSLLDAPEPRAEAGVGLGVWRMETARFGDHELELGAGWLDEAERERASSYVRAELQRAYVLAHAAARLVVAPRPTPRRRRSSGAAMPAPAAVSRTAGPGRRARRWSSRCRTRRVRC